MVDPDGIALLPMMDLFRLAITFRIPHRVTAETVSFNLKEIWATARTDLLNNIEGCLAHFHNIHPIDPGCGYAITTCFLAHIRNCRSACYSRAHPILVILTDPEHG